MPVNQDEKTSATRRTEPMRQQTSSDGDALVRDSNRGAAQTLDAAPDEEAPQASEEGEEPA